MGCWEGGRDVTSSLWCSHTPSFSSSSSSAHIRSPPFISISVLRALYSAALSVCVRVCVPTMTQPRSRDCGSDGVLGNRRRWDVKEEVSDPEQNASETNAVRRWPTWRPKPEEKACSKVLKLRQHLKSYLCSINPENMCDETKRWRRTWTRPFVLRCRPKMSAWNSEAAADVLTKELFQTYMSKCSFLFL